MYVDDYRFGTIIHFKFEKKKIGTLRSFIESRYMNIKKLQNKNLAT